jgi:DNA-binding response OmpR family regulator
MFWQSRRRFLQNDLAGEAPVYPQSTNVSGCDMDTLQTQKSNTRQAASAHRPRLLLIDSDLAQLRELTALLRQDFDVLHASDGQAGFHRAQAQRPDLILLDVVLPLIDGRSVARLLRSDPATHSVPFIFLTALNRPEQRIAGFELGAVDYIGKPFHPAEVVARVKVHLRYRAAGVAPPHGAAAPPGQDAAVATVRAAVHYVEKNLIALPPVAQIASHVGTTEQRLLGLFREHLGLTVSGFVAEARLRAGCRLLTETQMTIQQVAAEVGFRSPGNFTSAFKKRHGLSPKAWRQAALDPTREAGSPAQWSTAA